MIPCPPLPDGTVKTAEDRGITGRTTTTGSQKWFISTDEDTGTQHFAAVIPWPSPLLPSRYTERVLRLCARGDRRLRREGTVSISGRLLTLHSDLVSLNTANLWVRALWKSVVGDLNEWLRLAIQLRSEFNALFGAMVLQRQQSPNR